MGNTANATTTKPLSAKQSGVQTSSAKTWVAKPADFVGARKWFLVDASGKTLGRLACKIAEVLRGKDKPTYTPHVDTGDFVVVINAGKVKLTGGKEDKKIYYTSSRFVGSVKQKLAGQLLETNPERVIYNAVKGMLPKNKLNNKIIGKLKIYAGSEHPHKTQKPEALAL